MYKRRLVLSDVISLTMGNSVLPFGNCLAGNANGLGQFLLGDTANFS